MSSLVINFFHNNRGGEREYVIRIRSTSTGIVDLSENATIINHNINYTSTPSLFDSSNTAMIFNGTNSYLEMDNIDKIIGPNDDFTISLWILRHNFTPASTFPQSRDQVYLNSEVILVDDPYAITYPGFIFSSNTRNWENMGYYLDLYDEEKNNIDWNIFTMSANDFSKIPVPIHVAATRHKSRIRLFLNGIIKYEFNYQHTLFNGGKLITGVNPGTGSIQYSAFTLDDICLIKGAALWTSNFTPPTTYLPDKI